MNLAEYIHTHALYRSGHPAIIDARRDRRLTFSELDELAARTARHLSTLGVESGDRVGVCMRNETQTVVIALALWRLNAVWLPMDVRWPAVERRRVYDAFSPQLVIMDRRHGEPDWPVVCHDESWDQAVRQAEPWDGFAPGPDAPILIALTSGTTGTPRGCVYSHARYHALCLNYWVEAGIDGHHRSMSILPIAFAAGRGLLISSLVRGATVVQWPGLSAPRALVETARRFRVTALSIVPSLLRGLIAYADTVEPREWPLLGDLEVLISIGARLHPGEVKAVRQRLTPNVVNFYGSTGGGITTVLKGGDLERKAESVGRPVHGTRVEAVGETHEPLPPGSSGRLRCRSPGMALGSWCSDMSPDGAGLFRDGWHYPGDHGYLDEEGYLYLQGRDSEIIIRDGINVFAQQVEGALTDHPCIRDAAVVGIEDETHDERIVAFVVGADGIDDAALVNHCRSRLAAYKIPSRFIRLSELPRSNAGKVVKGKLLAFLAN